MKKALITGINGQDGSYLAEFLLNKGYKVVGLVRRSSIENSEKLKNISHILDKIELVTYPLDNPLSVYRMISSIQPDECYHLAGSSFVSYSLEEDISIMSNNFQATYNLLTAVIETCPKCKLYFAGSSEIFGDANVSPQTEETAYNPRSVYGISKLASHHLIKNYRTRYNIFACTGFTYNHESPRRGKSFVSRKITSAAAAISLGLLNKLELGNIDALRDWGYAPEYVEAMWKMLNAKQPVDYIISTGILHSVKDVLDIAFSYLNLDWNNYVVLNEKFNRGKEQISLCGNPQRIYLELGWKAKKDFKDMIVEMVENDLKKIKN